MNTKPVSLKVYRDITARISVVLSSVPSSEAEALRLVDAYLDGDVAVSSTDTMAMIAFSMIKAELERAIIRSARARERARKTRETRETKVSADTSARGEDSADAAPAMPLSRRERRAQARAATKKKNRFHCGTTRGRQVL